MGLLSGTTDPTTNIPKYNSNSEDWIQWHKDLRQNFGKKIANSLWIKAWRIRGNSSANTSDLRKYLDKQGIKISESAWDSVVDFGVGVSDAFGTAFQVTQYAGIGLAVIIVGGLGMVVYNLAKDPAKSIGVGARAFLTKGK
jgi:hypothetical protein